MNKMEYRLESVSIKTNNSLEGIQKIDTLWQDILNGNLPLLCDSKGHFQKEILPIAKYHHYEQDELGKYELTIIGVTNDFLQAIEKQVQEGTYIKIDECGENLSECTKKAWQIVWALQQNKKINRSFLEDFEYSLPNSYTKDGKAHCYLYISLK